MPTTNQGGEEKKYFRHLSTQIPEKSREFARRREEHFLKTLRFVLPRPGEQTFQRNSRRDRDEKKRRRKKEEEIEGSCFCGRSFKGARPPPLPSLVPLKKMQMV